MKNIQKLKLRQRTLRQQRVRRPILSRRAGLPRLTVFRSLKHFYLQLIDDRVGKTLCAASDWELKNKNQDKPVARAQAVGLLLAERAKAKKITRVVFDRGAYQYHGRVQAAAEGARAGGLVF